MATPKVRVSCISKKDSIYNKSIFTRESEHMGVIIAFVFVLGFVLWALNDIAESDSATKLIEHFNLDVRLGRGLIFGIGFALVLILAFIGFILLLDAASRNPM